MRCGAVGAREGRPSDRPTRLAVLLHDVLPYLGDDPAGCTSMPPSVFSTGRRLGYVRFAVSRSRSSKSPVKMSTPERSGGRSVRAVEALPLAGPPHRPLSARHAARTGHSRVRGLCASLRAGITYGGVSLPLGRALRVGWQALPSGRRVTPARAGSAHSKHGKGTHPSGHSRSRGLHGPILPATVAVHGALPLTRALSLLERC